MSVPAEWDPAYIMAYAVAEKIVGWFMGKGKRTNPESDRKQAAYKNVSAADEPGGRNPEGSGGTTSLGTRLANIFRSMKTALVPRKEYSQLPLFQTKPECYRKEGAYRNMSKALGWLGTAPAFLLKRGSSKYSIPAAQGRV